MDARAHQPLLLGSGPLDVATLLPLGGAGVWVVFANQWLPAAPDVMDLSVGVLRRQSAVIGVVYSVLAGPLFPSCSSGP